MEKASVCNSLYLCRGHNNEVMENDGTCHDHHSRRHRHRHRNMNLGLSLQGYGKKSTKEL